MNIGFFNPYFDSMSGGERYLLTLASHWSKKHTVSLFWDDHAILKESSERLNIDLSRIKTVENVFKTKNVFKKLAVSSAYDLIFFLTDGSIPTTFARRNILHFQVPFAEIPVHPIKLTRFQAIVCNSIFTKKHIDSHIGKRARVIYPPVEPVKLVNSAKKNCILSVGRFHHFKKQDILIEIFKKAAFKDFELILAGGLQASDEKYFNMLKKSAKGLSVRFFPNCSHDALIRLYNESLIYWHAAGFGETRPELMEHFGITTVEAMSAGCIPVVFNGGGQPEIVKENLWATSEECIEMTERIVQNKNTQKDVRQKMRTHAQKFDVPAFTKSYDDLLTHITR